MRSRWRRRGEDTKQLRVHYRDSSLSSPGRRGRLRAGDRVPDAVCTDAAGRGCRLYDLLRGPQPVLLAFGPRAAAVRCGITAVAVGDPSGHIRRSYGLSADGFVLVRPDGYIALIAPHEATAQLDAAIARIGFAA